MTTILHISDLHFDENLIIRRGLFGRKGPTLFQKTHDEYKLAAFANRLRKLKEEGYGYDIVVGTGDLTTDGSRQAICTAHTFFESDDSIFESPSGGPPRFAGRGLGVRRAQRVVLPGNHDRFHGKLIPRQRPNGEFEAIFEVERYPYVVGYRHPSLIYDSTKTTLLFFVFDSTLVQRTMGLMFWQSDIARGYLIPMECEWLESAAQEIANEREVDSLDGTRLRFDPHNCIRIAVLHHHPIVAARAKKKRLTHMENDRLFIRSCFKAGINIVLFGHEHVAYQLRKKPPDYLQNTPFGKMNDLYFFCCPSTLQAKESKNGFYLFRFNEYRNLTVYFYELDSTFLDSASFEFRLMPINIEEVEND